MRAFLSFLIIVHYLSAMYPETAGNSKGKEKEKEKGWFFIFFHHIYFHGLGVPCVL